MAKRKKKKRSSARSQGRSSSAGRWLENQLDQVERLQQAGAYEEAFDLLLALEKRYPRDRNLLAMFVNVAGAMENWVGTVIYSLRLYPLETENDRAIALNNLMLASIQLQLPALACKAASILLADHPNYDFIKSAKYFLQTMQPQLIEAIAQMESISEKFAHDQAKVLDFMAEHDLMTLFTDILKKRIAAFPIMLLPASTWPVERYRTIALTTPENTSIPYCSE